jgi:indole-3-glycerol phosphate synthase
VAHARERAEALVGARRERLSGAAAEAAPPRDFAGALRRDRSRPDAPGPLRVIAELKRRSPSAGAIREDLDPVSAAIELEAAGAKALSVLTEPRFFGGDLAFLTAVRRAVDLPLLRKDFVVDPVQIVEARAHGADAVLLLAVVLDDDELLRCAEEAARWGMAVLAESHDEAELERILRLDLPVVGVNARDLRSFEVDLDAALARCASIPSPRIRVAESGVRERADAERVFASGVDAVLVGEGLMRPGTPTARFEHLFGGLA